VEGWLPIEHYVVTVLEVAFHDVAVLEVHVRPLFELGEVDLATIDSDNILGARPLVRTIFDEFAKFFDIVDSHLFRHS